MKSEEKMKPYHTVTIRTGAAALLCLLPLLAGCKKDELGEGPRSGNGEIRISASTGSVIAEEGTKSSGEPEIIELRSEDGTITIPMAVFVSDTEDGCTHGTKGQLINDNKYGDYSPMALQEALGTFTLHALNGATSFFDEADSTATWDVAGSRWKMGRSYYWPNETVLGFYAYANMPAPTVAYVKPKYSERKQMLHYEVPGHTDDQTDIILGVYEGTGNAAGEAEIEFHHPLSAVQFKRNPSAADLEGTISITMEGVYYIGEVEQSLDNPKMALSDWRLIKKGQTVTQDNHGLPLIVHGGIDGDPFLIIPQVVDSESRILLSVTLLINGHKIPLNAVIDYAVWEPGKTYTYVVGYTGGLKVELDETSPSEEVRENVIVKNTDVKVAYVRAMVLGYITDQTGGIKSMWVNDDGTNKGTFTVTDGEFGSTTEAWNTTGGTGGWIKGTDGFFYYRKPLQSANPALGTDPDAMTTPLFDRYSISDIGTNNHFQLDIAVQSVEYDDAKDFVRATWGEYAAGLLE